jgi:hypothetical protein
MLVVTWWRYVLFTDEVRHALYTGQFQTFATSRRLSRVTRLTAAETKAEFKERFLVSRLQSALHSRL